MPGWISQSFNEHTIIWLLISSIVGGIIGSGITFVYEDVLRPWLSFRRDTDRLVRKYTTPLLRSAESLERRLENFVVNLPPDKKANWYAEDEYYRVSTLFVFADYLGVIGVLEREFGFVPVESGERGSLLRLRLNGLYRAVTSQAYFHDDIRVDLGAPLPRFMLRAIGEVMAADSEEAKVNPAQTLGFTEFVHNYGSDAQFQRWFAELDDFLRSVTGEPDDPRRARLIAAQANLRALMIVLDWDGRMVKAHRWDRLLGRLPEDSQLRSALAAEFADVSDRALKLYDRDRKQREEATGGRLLAVSGYRRARPPRSPRTPQSRSADSH